MAPCLVRSNHDITSANLLFTLAGAVAFIVGLVTLLRPSLIRALLHIKPSEPSTACSSPG